MRKFLSSISIDTGTIHASGDRTDPKRIAPRSHFSNSVQVQFDAAGGPCSQFDNAEQFSSQEAASWMRNSQGSIQNASSQLPNVGARQRALVGSSGQSVPRHVRGNTEHDLYKVSNSNFASADSNKGRQSADLYRQQNHQHPGAMRGNPAQAMNVMGRGGLEEDNYWGYGAADRAQHHLKNSSIVPRHRHQ